MADNDVATHEGFALRLDESHEVMNAVQARVILFMGDRDAGKTTMLAELHRAYLTSPFAGFMFAGSRTLIGFEQRCFLSRLRSGNAGEDTERTKSFDIKLLHLALAPEGSPAAPAHLLLTDVSGELFRDIRSSGHDAREFAPFVRRADEIVLLIDGERLAEAHTRMATRTNAAMLLKCLLEAGGLSEAASLHVVITKWDRVVALSAEKHADDFEKSILRIEGLSSPRNHRVASRVTGQVAGVTAGFGLNDLVSAWMNPAPRAAPAVVLSDKPTSVGRWFGRYEYRGTA